MESFIIYCPHLNRDIRNLLNAVPFPKIATGYPTERGEDGCLESHKAIVREAKDRCLPYVAVFEDDCQLTQHFYWEYFKAVAHWAYVVGFGAVHGGSVLTHNPRVVSKNDKGAMIAVDKACSAHCMIYTRHGYDAVLAAEQPFDLSIGEKGVKPILTWPFIAVQRAEFSGILKQNVNYEPLYQMHEDHLGLVLSLQR